MTQLNQNTTENKPYFFFEDPEIEDWFKKNHTISYLKFKSKIEPLKEKINKCEIFNSEMEKKINELIEDSGFISKKIEYISANSNNIFAEDPGSLVSVKLLSFFLQSGLSLFPVISIYALIHHLIDKITGNNYVSIITAAFFGFSLSHFSSRIVQFCSSLYWSELRTRNTSRVLFLLFALIVLLESFIGAYGINYLIENELKQSTLDGTVRNQVLFFAPTLFSLINILYSFGREMKQQKIPKITDLITKEGAIHQSIKNLRDRIQRNYEELLFYRKTYNEALFGHEGLFNYLDTEKDSINSLYGSRSKADGNEDLIIKVHFSKDSMNSYYELNNHGITKTIESNNEALTQVSQIISKLIPSQQQINEELHSKLTVYESADILNVSIPYVINLIESSKIPSQIHGKAFYIDLNDLLLYKQESDLESHSALVELAREAQELDMGY